MPVNSQFDFRAIFVEILTPFGELCSSAHVSIPENTSKVFSLALQNLESIKEHSLAVVAKPVVRERVSVVEETVASFLAGSTFEKIDMVVCPESRARRWSVSTPPWWLFANRSQVKPLCNHSLVRHKTPLLG